MVAGWDRTEREAEVFGNLLPLKQRRITALEACEPDMHSHFLPRRESLLNAALLFFDGEYDQIDGSDSSESRI